MKHFRNVSETHPCSLGMFNKDKWKINTHLSGSFLTFISALLSIMSIIVLIWKWKMNKLINLQLSYYPVTDIFKQNLFFHYFIHELGECIMIFLSTIQTTFKSNCTKRQKLSGLKKLCWKMQYIALTQNSKMVLSFFKQKISNICWPHFGLTITRCQYHR